MNTKKAIIVGASSGIGREVAIRLIEDGWTVGIAARRQEALYDIKACYPKQVEVANIDITKEEAGTQLLRLIDTLGVSICISMPRASASRTCHCRRISR